jgi:hypothetical protein
VIQFIADLATRTVAIETFVADIVKRSKDIEVLIAALPKKGDSHLRVSNHRGFYHHSQLAQPTLPHPIPPDPTRSDPVVWLADPPFFVLGKAPRTAPVRDDTRQSGI